MLSCLSTYRLSSCPLHFRFSGLAYGQPFRSTRAWLITRWNSLLSGSCFGGFPTVSCCVFVLSDNIYSLLFFLLMSFKHKSWDMFVYKYASLCHHFSFNRFLMWPSPLTWKPGSTPSERHALVENQKRDILQT